MIKSFTIEENNKLSRFLINYKKFFKYFEGENVILAFISKNGIVYYAGKYTLNYTREYKNLLINMNSYFIENFNYINENSFMINIENMNIINLVYTRNQIPYELTKDEIDTEIKRLKSYNPEFCLNNIIINSIPYKIQILYNYQWYAFNKSN